MAGSHPTIDEQLDGIARLIDRTVERLDTDPSADRLSAAAGTLRRIAGSWHAMAGYLSWDTEATLAVLEAHADVLPDGLTDRARRLAAEPADDPLDGRAAQDDNLAARDLLAEAVRSLPDDARAARTAFTSHLRERIARDPVGRPRT